MVLDEEFYETDVTNQKECKTMNTNTLLTLLNPVNVNTFGLIFDMLGTILLFKFGLPKEISRSGHSRLILEQEDPEEKKKAENYDKFGKAGIFFLFIGFLFQALSNFL